MSVKHITGKTITFSTLTLSSTVAELKALFEEAEHVPAAHQGLIINAKVAEDDQQLKKYGKL